MGGAFRADGDQFSVHVCIRECPFFHSGCPARLAKARPFNRLPRTGDWLTCQSVPVQPAHSLSPKPAGQDLRSSCTTPLLFCHWPRDWKTSYIRQPQNLAATSHVCGCQANGSPENAAIENTQEAFTKRFSRYSAAMGGTTL